MGRSVCRSAEWREHTIKIVGLLSWYDENPNWLSACVAGMARLCTHLIAVDGPYMLFPGSLRQPRSNFDQVDAISRAADAAGLTYTIHVHGEPWWGGEVEKRDFMFRLGEDWTTSDDWFFIVDADEVVAADERSRLALAETDRDVAECWLWEQIGGMEPSGHPLRRIFRALPEMHIEEAHYVLTAHKGGEKVWLSGLPSDSLEPALMLHDVRMEHRNRYRTPVRAARSLDYYARREEQGVERRLEHATG